MQSKEILQFVAKNNPTYFDYLQALDNNNLQINTKKRL